ncbi:hypothetical protein PGB90_004898 [Kerria lacca]
MNDLETTRLSEEEEEDDDASIEQLTLTAVCESGSLGGLIRKRDRVNSISPVDSLPPVERIAYYSTVLYI